MPKQKSVTSNGPPGSTKGAARPADPVVTKARLARSDQPRASRRDRADRYRRLVEILPDAITVESGGRCVLVNPALVRLLGGASVREFLGTALLDWIHPDARARVAARWGQLEARAWPITKEKLLRRDGGSVDVEIAALPFRHQGKPARLLIFHDITRHERALKALRDTENLFRQVVDSEMVGILFWDMHGNITHANSAFLRMVGLSHEDVLAGRVRWKELTAPEHAPRDDTAMRELIEKGVCTPYEKDLVRRDQRRVPVLIGAALLQDLVESGVSFCLNITQRRGVERERDRLFQELQQAHDRLRLLSARLVAVQEAERRRIARELHDEVGQELTALKLKLQGIEPQTDGSPAGALGSVDRLLSLVRDMSLELRPTMLDDLGLAPALYWQCDRHAALGRLRVRFRHHGIEGRRFASEIETAAYRIVQEALTNVVRHSGADEANVLLWANDERLTVQVRDGGRGFEVESALSAGTSSGLSGMRERVALLGGRFSLESAPNGGTHLTAELPLRLPSLTMTPLP